MPGQTLDLPELHQAILDPQTLDQLFTDIDQCTRLVEVMVKIAPQVHTPETTAFSLEQARQMFDEGSALGVQLRYVYQESHWWDTLMRTQQGIRLVRIRHVFDLSAAPTDNQP